MVLPAEMQFHSRPDDLLMPLVEGQGPDPPDDKFNKAAGHLLPQAGTNYDDVTAKFAKSAKSARSRAAFTA